MSADRAASFTIGSRSPFSHSRQIMDIAEDSFDSNWWGGEVFRYRDTYLATPFEKERPEWLSLHLPQGIVKLFIRVCDGSKGGTSGLQHFLKTIDWTIVTEELRFWRCN